MRKRMHWGFPLGGLLLLLVHNVTGTLIAATELPPGITTQFDPVTRIDHAYDQELMDFLDEAGEQRGYTNYWVGYPLAFKSDERIIFIPRLPYHQDLRYTSRDDRYPPYDDLVATAEKVAYITTNHPDLDQRLRDGFEANGIEWEEQRIGDFQIFYQLSERIDPQRLNLGEDYP